MIKNKLPIVSLIFYILAGLFLIFAVWAAVFSFRYIGSMVEMGQLVVKDNLFEVTSFHISNFGQYVVYAAVLFGIGWIVQLITFPDDDDFFDELEDEELEIDWDDVTQEVEQDAVAEVVEEDADEA